MRLRRDGNLLSVESPAKLNLFLELLGKRSDGFHQIETVMTTVSLVDQLRFRPTSDGQFHLQISMASRGPSQERDSIPTDQRNLIVKSLQLLRETGIQDGGCDANRGMSVWLSKRIPSAAGMGGASSNAAAALIAGNQIWKLGFSETKLCQLAAQLGSDIPFFIAQSTAICEGRGEMITALPNRSVPMYFAIVKPSVGLATKDVFGCSVIPDDKNERRSSARLVRCLAAGKIRGVGANLFNRMESAASRLTDRIETIKNLFEKLPCLGHQMSGSGSSYFGLFPHARAARVAARILRAQLPGSRVFEVRSLSAVASPRQPLLKDRVVALQGM